MLIVLADTHGTEDPRLTDHLRDRLRAGEVVVHAGDFTTEAVLEAFGEYPLCAVRGNSDESGVCERLPATRTVEWGGRRLVVTHGHRRGPTSLSLLVRERRADGVIVGHTHRPTAGEHAGTVVVNPGSHADPRGGTASYATFERTEDEGDGIVGRIRAVTDGAVLGTVVL